MEKEGKNAEIRRLLEQSLACWLIFFNYQHSLHTMGASIKNIKCICVFLMQQYHQIFPNFKYFLLFEPGTELQSNSEYKQGGKKRKEQ